MDRMDRLLRALPGEDPSPDLAGAILVTIHRRFRRRQVARRVGAFLLGLLGLWLVWPGLAWLSSGEIFAPGTSWFMGGLSYVNSGSLDMLNSLWNTIFSAQNAIGSSVAWSTWLGAVLVCCSIFLALDARAWQSPAGPHVHGGRSTMLASSVHG